MTIIVVYPYIKVNQHNVDLTEQTDKKENEKNNEVLVNMEKVDSINDEKEKLAEEKESKRLEEIRMADEKRKELEEEKKKKTGTFVDNRDGKIYKWVKVGSQNWMAENLAYKPNSGNYWAYDNEYSYVSKYGYLYDWKTACNVCPDGWHLPTDREWKELEMAIGMSSSDADDKGFRGANVGNQIKTSSWGGNNSSGFTALPGGYRNTNGSFYYEGSDGLWWSATESGTNARARGLGSSQSDVNRGAYDKGFGFSVRCIRN